MLDMLIANGSVLSERESFQAHVGIEDGKVAALFAPGSPPPAALEVIDATDLLVCPGAVDAHTHFTGLHHRHEEGVTLGTRAAAAGGVTTVLEHPQSNPPATTVDRFRAKRRMMAAHASIDFAMWGGVEPTNLAELPSLHQEGAIAFKGFMCSTRPDGQAPDSFGLPRLDDDVLWRAMEVVAGIDGILGLHAENHAILNGRTRELMAAGRKDPLAHAAASPPTGEVEAVSRALLLARASRARCHIVHLSVAEAAALVQDAKDGARVSAETCPHYLTLDETDLARLGAYGRCAPPLRPRPNVDALWKHLTDGTLEFVASDHCPYLPEQKAQGGSTIWKAPLGLTGVQTMAPLLLGEAVHGGRLGLADFVRLTSAGPARFFGLYPRKGVIRPGSDADLVLYDPRSSWTVRGAEFIELSKWTPFEGRACQARVVRTLVRGRTVYHDGQILVPPGFGAFVMRAGLETVEGAARA
jgi:allantoinase